MTMRDRAARAALLFLLLPAVPLLSGCGVGGGTTVGEFQQIVIGPEGGTAAAQNVSLVIPPGAFTEDHVLDVQLQPFPLPIEPQGDGSTIEYHDNIMCIGPLGLPLLVDGHLRMTYPDSGYPKGLGEDDLVLLVWDEAAQLMRVSPTAVQSLLGDRFDDFDYDELGHCAVGVRIPSDDPPEFDFAFEGVPESVSTTGGKTVEPLIVLADLDGALPDTEVPGTEDARAHLGNGDGTRFLWLREEFQQESTSLHTTDVPSLDTRQIAGPQEFSGFGSLYGWANRSDVLYVDRSLPLQEQGEPVPFEAFATIDGAGVGPFDDVYPYPGDRFLEDVRISPDHTMAVLRFFRFGKSFDIVIDVIDLLGNVVAADAVPGMGFDDPTPRWMPDSSGIYWVEPDGTTVSLLEVDDLEVSTLYTMTVANSVLVDFVVAPPFQPDPQRCAYVRREFSVRALGLPGGTGDFYETDALAGGDLTSYDLGESISVVEMVPLFSDNWQTSLVLLEAEPFFGEVQTEGIEGSASNGTLVLSLDPAGLWTQIPAPISNIDLSRQPGYEGQMLVWIEETNTDSFPEYPTVGLYHLDSSAGNPTLVTPPGLVPTGPARWLQSWRHSPGFFSFDGVR
jgi:hypothetical protein